MLDDRYERYPEKIIKCPYCGRDNKFTTGKLSLICGHCFKAYFRDDEVEGGTEDKKMPDRKTKGDLDGIKAALKFLILREREKDTNRNVPVAAINVVYDPLIEGLK